jgi:hypothetical protein
LADLDGPPLAKVAAADASSRRALLEAIRDRLIAELDGDAGHRVTCRCKCGVPPDARTVPTLAKELRELLKEIDGLPDERGESILDDLAEKRRRRQGGAREQAAAGS